MCTFVHTRENVQTWIGFAELAKGSVPPMNRGKLSDQNIKIMKRLFLFSLLVLFLLSAKAQPIQSVWQFYKDLQSVEFQSRAADPYVDVAGSPYEQDEFINGTVMTRQGIKYVDIPLRYNVFADEMEFLTDDDNVMYLSPEATVEYITIADEKYIFVPFIRSNQRQRGYFRLLSEGKASLLLRQHIRYHAAEKAQPFRDPQPPRFTRSPDEYYVRIMGRDALRVSNRREMRTVFADKQTLMNDFARRNRISFRHPADLKALVEYYNSLHDDDDQ